MKTETIQCLACPHVQVVQGAPFCGFCDRPVTPGNVNVSRAYLPQSDACKMAAVLRIATGEELLKAERILHGYV